MTDRVTEIGALVEDRDDDCDDPNHAAVVNRPPVPADEWVAYGDTTVAEDNPEYDGDADVVVVAFCDDLADAHPDWNGDAPLSLPLECSVYAFPPERLRRVGHVDDDAGDDTRADRDTEDETDATDESDDSAAETADSPLTDGQAQLRDRLAESAEVTVETDGDAPVLVVEKLGGEHRILPDGTVKSGPLADRLGEVAAEYLGGETA